MYNRHSAGFRDDDSALYLAAPMQTVGLTKGMMQIFTLTANLYAAVQPANARSNG